MHTNGANHTRSTSQFHTAFLVSSGQSTSQPSASTLYAAYLAIRVDNDAAEDDGEEKDRGRPMDTASAAAREKLSTEVIETSAEAKQRLNAFRTEGMGACPADAFGTACAMTTGTPENSRKRAGPAIWR